MLRDLLLWAIHFYQRHLSPHKGFSCAYSDFTGRRSCSHLGLRAVRRYGALRGLGVLRRRTRHCGVAYRRYAPLCARPLRNQRGDCDPGCDLPCDCDSPGGGKGPSRLCGFIDCCHCSSGCDWPDRDRRRERRRKRSADDDMHLPPPRRRADRAIAPQENR